MSVLQNKAFEELRNMLGMERFDEWKKKYMRHILIVKTVSELEMNVAFDPNAIKRITADQVRERLADEIAKQIAVTVSRAAASDAYEFRGDVVMVGVDVPERE
jgi:predicted membrane GTPase involved in stress response